ncbi:MAG: cytochrome c3 family protein [Desulfuromonadaceae bacterium]
MRKLLITTFLVIFAATAAMAADSVVFEAKNGNVTFDHKAHGEKLGCDVCHEGTPAKIEVNKDVAHKAACKDCHKEKNGPTKCGDCHKK